MPLFLILTFLFFIGSTVGWGIEVLFRRFFSASNPERKWINPGFLIGPYLPLYGFSLVILYLLAGLERNIGIENVVLEKAVLFVLMALCVTVLEYFTGLFCNKVLKVKLWDYSMLWGNFQGIICPLFSLFWLILSATYYFLVHPHMLSALLWLSENLAFSFFVGLFIGVFAVDVCYSCKVLPTIKRYAEEQELTVKYDELRESIRKYREDKSEKARFFLSMYTSRPFIEHLREYGDKLKEQAERETEKWRNGPWT